MRRHRLGGPFAVAGEQGLDNRQMLVAFLGDAVVIVAFFFLLPGDIAEGPEQRFEPEIGRASCRERV